MPFFNIEIPADYSGSDRLDKYISSLPNGMNRSKLKSGVSKVLINDKKAKLATKVVANDKIYIELEDNVPENITPENIPLDIIFEDENVTVINKKQGMVTHPASGNWSGTLVNALLFHWNREAISHKEKNSNSEMLKARRPGIVHRLDKDTSGVIITAKNRDTEEWLGEQFRDHKKLSKIYICICTGHPKEKNGEIKTNIARDPENRKKFKAFPLGDKGKIAITKYKCIATYGPYSLFFVKILTGRTHQIRVHLKHIGCPILGDPIYAKSTKGTIFEGSSLMLHAYKLKIKTSKTEIFKTFTAPVPLRFKKVIKKLHEKFEKI